MVGERNLPEQAHDADAGVVDPHVDVAGEFLGAHGEPLDGVRIADVRGHGQCATAGLGDLRDHLVEQRGTSGGDDDVGAPRTERQ